MSTPIVISYDNAPTETTRNLTKSLERHGWTYRLIGGGEKWEGFKSKLNGYYNTLQELEDDRLVVLVDARDVVSVRSPKAFLDGFLSFHNDMVVSMELFCCGQQEVADDFKGYQCIPLIRYWNHYNIKPLPYRKFVNSGLIAGRVHALRQWLSWTILNDYDDDQLALCNYMNTFPERVAADADALLLHTSTFGVNAGLQCIHIQSKDSPTLAELYGRGAFFIHIPGTRNPGQKTLYDSVCSLLESGFSDISLRKGYTYKEPAWKGFDG